MRHGLTAIAVLFLIIGLVGCASHTAASTPATPTPTDTLTKVAAVMPVIAKSVGDLQTFLIAQHTAGQIPDATYTAILQTCLKIDQAGKQADALLKPLTALDGTSKATLFASFQPLVQAIADAANSGQVGIKDPGTQQTISTILGTLQAALTGLVTLLQ